MSTRKPTEQEAFDALLRHRLAAFTRKAFATVDPGAVYKHNWHIDLIAEYLEACTARQIKRLIINMPPGYLKSISVNVAWPAWLLGKNPSERILSASYSESLSLKHSIDCRQVVTSDWYRRAFPGTTLTGDQNEKQKFMTTARGFRFATSVGGSSTGDGGNFLIVDDPHNPRQAESTKERETGLIWFDRTFSNRLRDKENGVIVVVMQRLNAQDLTGHLLEKGGWEQLSLPGIAETRTVIDFGRVKVVREPGDVLHPSFEPPHIVERQKIDMGSYAFAGQYQQRPAPADGGIFKSHWFKRYAKPQDVYEKIVQSWDTASKAGELNDPSCCITFGVRKDGFDVLQVLTRRLEYPELKSLVVKQAENFGADAVLIEDKASGQQLLQDLKRSTTLPLIGILPEKDKITRAAAVSAMVEAGNVFLPTSAPWLADFEMEMLTFPNAAHDDQCLVAGTRIATKRGWVPIEQVAAGDEVVTPEGWRKVVAAGPTGVQPVIRCVGLTGTSGHPIFTVDKSYQDMDSLTQESHLVRLSLCGLLKTALLMSLSSTVYDTDGWAASAATISRNQLAIPNGKVPKAYMSQFGSFIRARQYRQATRLITKTATLSTSSLTIWSAFRLRCIGQFLNVSICRNSVNISTKSGTLRQRGTALTRGESGIGSMLSTLFTNIPSPTLKRLAYSAAPSSSPSGTSLATAGMNVVRNTAGSTATGTVGKKLVYNLTVADANCYYANGILVHNCDSLTQFLNWHRTRATAAPRIRTL